MKRREFLRAGGVAAAGVIAPAAAANPLDDRQPKKRSQPLAPRDMQRYLKTVDAGRERIRSWDFKASIGFTGENADSQATLARNSMEALFMTGMLGDLPLASQVDDGMQARMAGSVSAIDDAVAGTISYLQNLTKEETDRVQRYFEQSENPGMEIAELMDAQAKGVGVSNARRRQLRALVTRVSHRLKNHAPTDVVDEYVGKAQRFQRSDGRDFKRQQRFAEEVAEQLFWEKGTVATPVPAPGNGGPRIMGIGAVILLGSILLISMGAWPALFTATLGVILILVGMVISIVAAAQKD